MMRSVACSDINRVKLPYQRNVRIVNSKVMDLCISAVKKQILDGWHVYCSDNSISFLMNMPGNPQFCPNLLDLH